jgi:hypothetical protein
MARRDLIFRVFVSSTFSDLKAERNALQQHVFPALRKYCQEHGARFQAIDLRWGVSTEAALDQQTMNICFQELARCQEMSPRPNFIILLGERYGWRPLPARIPANEFESLLDIVPEAGRALLAGEDTPVAWCENIIEQRIGWYRKDRNAVPEEYVLQPRTIFFPENVSAEDMQRMKEAEAQDWQDIESAMGGFLRDAINALGWSMDDPRRTDYEQSATHQEIEHGAFQASEAEKHVFAYFREITGAPENGPASTFIDTGKDKDDLQALKEQIGLRLPPEHIFKYAADWNRVETRDRSRSRAMDLHNEPDLSQLCDEVLRDLQDIIDMELRAFQQHPELEREVDAHREFATERSRHFIGRRKQLNRIKKYLANGADQLPLVIHGVSGTGKTALMARAWLTLTAPDQAVARFIGATPQSADLGNLLRSLCRQLGIDSPPIDMNELIEAFRERLSGPVQGEEGAKPGPTVVFLDALDQLSPTDNAQMLDWLPRQLASGVKLILSVLEEEQLKTEESKTAVNGPFRIDQKIWSGVKPILSMLGKEQPKTEVSKTAVNDPFSIARQIWPKSLARIGCLAPEDGKELLKSWLDEVNRTLQKAQENDVLTKFNEDGRPLYLKIAFEEARLWRSWDGLPCTADGVSGLHKGIEGILADMLQRLELPRQHGRLLVERALSNVAAAKNGLTEDEILDVLSREKAVMNDYFARNPESPQEIDRLPIVVWSRLYADMKPYMTERRADGTVVMNFYHRQVGKAVTTRYLREKAAKLAAHDRLGDYFHTLDYWAESLEAQRARAKRLPQTPRPANIRKVVELPYHRLEAAKLGGNFDPKSKYWDVVADLLTDWQFLEAKAEADPNSSEGNFSGLFSVHEVNRQ